MKSFDRYIPKKGGQWTAGEVAIDYTNKYVRARVVPWPEGAPDPSTVPQAGEQVVRKSWSGRRAPVVYTVVNGIPKNDRSNYVWRLWVRTSTGGSEHLNVKDIEVYVEPPQTYTEDEIRAAFRNTPRYGDTIIDTLRERS